MPMQMQAMKAYVKERGWLLVEQIKDIGSGASERPKREVILKAARRREIDVIVVWRLDRWGRSLLDLVMTLKELSDLSIGFVSLTEALDLTTPIGRAMAGLLSVFAEFEREVLRERIKAGIAQAKREGRKIGRPRSASDKEAQIKQLHAQGLNNSQIAKQLHIGRTSVRRILGQVN